MKPILFYLLLMFVIACGPKKTNTSSDPVIDKKKDSCFCDVDRNFNLISDSVMNYRKSLWITQLQKLYPNVPLDSLPRGFNISIKDIQSLAELLNKDKYPDPTSVMAYFTFDDSLAATSGRITAVFVPVYPAKFPPCQKGCIIGKSFKEGEKSRTQTINIDLTQPCPPICD